MARDFPGQVTAPPKKPAKDAPPEQIADWEQRRKTQSSNRICVEHAIAEPKQWRPLQRYIGRREHFEQTMLAIAGLVFFRGDVSKDIELLVLGLWQKSRSRRPPAVGGGQAQVPLHRASPFHRSAACCWPRTQAIARRTVARCSSLAARPRPERRRWTCARRPAGPGSRTAGLRRFRGEHPATGQPARLARRHRGPGRLDPAPAPTQRPDTRRRGGISTPMLLARSRHASVRSLERYARPGVDAVARHVAERDPAARRRQ
jgi:hypothetical protein